MSDGIERSETAERVARSDAISREANERIGAVASSFAHDEGELLPLLCECADPTHFVNAQGHVANGQGWARVVEERGRYAVVAKIGDAAAVAVELDPREGAST